MQIVLVIPVLVVRIIAEVVVVRIAVCPSIDRDGRDISCRIESAAGESARQLPADTALDRFEGSRQQFVSAETMLLAPAEALIRPMRKALHVNDDRFVRTRGVLVSTHADREIEHRIDMVAARGQRIGISNGGDLNRSMQRKHEVCSLECQSPKFPEAVD
jgi:hypothetical protein